MDGKVAEGILMANHWRYEVYEGGVGIGTFTTECEIRTGDTFFLYPGRLVTVSGIEAPLCPDTPRAASLNVFSARRVAGCFSPWGQNG